MIDGTCEACGRPDRRLRSRKLKNASDSPLIWACAEDQVTCRKLAENWQRRIRRRLAREQREQSEEAGFLPVNRMKARLRAGCVASPFGEDKLRHPVPLGMARQGVSGHGQPRQGQVRRGKAWLGGLWSGLAGSGLARYGGARSGLARCGLAR